MNKREKQKNETIADILKVSAELFQEYGYEKTSIQMIADRCGLSKGALYHHFASKEEVLERISRDFYESAIELFLPLTKEKGISMSERLKNIMTVARQSQMNTASATYSRGSGGGADSVDNAVLEKIFERDSEKIYEEVFAPLFEDGRESGECRFDGSAHVLARFIHNLDNGMSRQLNEVLQQPERPDAEDSIEKIIQGFSFVVSSVLGMSVDRINEITLAGEMMEQYRKILKNRRREP